jgi:hypothetical protein
MRNKLGELVFRRDAKARFVKTGFSILTLYRFESGRVLAKRELSKKSYKDLLQRQVDTPVSVAEDRNSKRTWWMYQSEFFFEDEGYSEDDVKALAFDNSRKRERRVEKAAARMQQGDDSSPGRRDSIRQDVKADVWNRDGGKCVNCGSRENLEFDHIIPVALGGANTARNIQLLCQSCNRSKQDSLG